jgi:ArsR family transcriptional regulator
MAILDLGQSTASKHLGILKSAGLIECRKRGTWIFYRLSDKKINTYNLNFLSFTGNSLSDDSLIRDDKRKLRAILKKDIKKICK